jgi:predicted metal-dependent enzyme (double-stranded beta helix superfamily)
MVPAEGDSYRTVLLWSDAGLNLSLLALVWRFGQRTPIHNHHAACVVGLYCGSERETRYERTSPGAETVVCVGETILHAGMVTVVPPDDHEIHRVEALEQAPGVTVSLHFYEVDVTQRPGCSSIRERFTELAGKRQPEFCGVAEPASFTGANRAYRGCVAGPLMKSVAR